MHPVLVNVLKTDRIDAKMKTKSEDYHTVNL